MDRAPRSFASSFLWTNVTKTSGVVASAVPSTNATESACKLSLLWNWNVKDTCFIAESVRINNKVQFAFLCLGVILLAVILQCLHRICRMYDRVLHQNRLAECSHESPNRSGTLSVPNLPGFFIENGTPSGYSYTATLGEQSIRAMLYTLVLAISYLILGLMLSFNGYIIFCALAGAWLGNLAFGVDSLRGYGAGCCGEV